MVTIIRTGALRIVIFLDDHDPPHVHVVGDGETKIELGDSPMALRVLFSVRTKANEKRRAVEAVHDNHAYLLQRWNELNG